MNLRSLWGIRYILGKKARLIEILMLTKTLTTDY